MYIVIGDLIPEPEEAELFDICLRTLRAWRSRGYGPAWLKIGRTIYYTPKANREFIEGAAQESCPPPRRRGRRAEVAASDLATMERWATGEGWA